MQRVRVTIAPRLGPDALAVIRAALPSTPAICVIAGAEPGGFCDGLDPGWASAATTDELVGLLAAFSATLAALAAVPGPSVALVDGAASGGGVAIACATDLVIASPRATFGLPEVFSGLVPAVALPWVARRIGATRARSLALGGAALGAEEARALGLVDVIADDLDAALEQRARRWSRASPAALAAVKALPVADDAAGLEIARGLIDSADTRARLARAAAGDPPWEDA